MSEDVQTTMVQIPASGLRGLAIQVWPDDRNEETLVQEHISYLEQLNADLLPNPDTYMANQLVRIPVLS
jgi:hypothetical protein